MQKEMMHLPLPPLKRSDFKRMKKKTKPIIFAKDKRDNTEEMRENLNSKKLKRETKFNYFKINIYVDSFNAQYIL